MTSKIEILTEEESIIPVLEKIIKEKASANWQKDTNYFIQPFEGKGDLMKKLSNRIDAYRYEFCETVGVIVFHDQDENDCLNLKREILNKCNDYEHLKVRIVCKELEAWFYGDLAAIESAYPRSRATSLINKAKYRNPDTIVQPHKLLFELTKVKSKIKIAEAITPHLNLENNRSKSFKVAVSGIENFFREMETS